MLTEQEMTRITRESNKRRRLFLAVQTVKVLAVVAALLAIAVRVALF